jgi:hypothetical protein
MHIGRGGTGNVVKDAPALAKSPVPSTTGAGAVSEKPASPPATAAAADKEKSPSLLGGDSSKEDSEGDDVAVPARRPEEIGWAEKGKNLLFGKK